MLARIKAVLTQRSLRRYLLVGAFNTGLDLALYTALSVGVGIPALIANAMSTTIVLCISYFLNRIWVFNSSANLVRSSILFVSVTLFSGLIVQSGVIWCVLALGGWAFPTWSPDLLKVIAKVIAIGVGMITNYIGYHWLFKEDKNPDPPAQT
ncbi:MAG: GtrA family protein [Propionibacteriaceae bacterium]|nr:GtrA family protein [Propionibacteriaceae bacterium]